MRKIMLGLTTAALLALPAAAAPASQEIPDVNCGIAGCPWDQTAQNVQDCVDGAKRAIAYIIQGTPQPQECNLP